MMLGISQLSHIVVALPLKILLFFAVDGWGLIAEKLLKTYSGG
jgi:type III secretory pathway component EscR